MENRQKSVQKLKFLAKKFSIPLTDKEILSFLNFWPKIPEVRENKVRQLRNSIELGNYKPSSEKKAAAILKNGLEFELLCDLEPYIMFDLELPTSSVIQSIPTGKEYAPLFHKLGSICVSDIFDKELTSPITEIRAVQGSRRFDLMVFNSAKAGFWAKMEKAHKITHVIFEFKNGKQIKHIDFAGQVARYSEKNRALVLVIREEPSEKIYHECSELYKKTENFIPLAISDEKIEMASQLKKIGDSPSNIFEKPYLRLRAG